MAWIPDHMSPSGFRWVEDRPSGVGGVLDGATQNYSAKNGLMDTAAAGGAFANTAQGNYNDMTGESKETRDYLAGLMRGDNSVSAEQLRQGLQQNVAAQRSMAAGAAPQNAAMAARTAAMQTGRLGSGLAGQQAMAGLQERNNAAALLGQLQGQSRGQDLQGVLGGQQNAIGGYGAANQQQQQGPKWWERGLGMIGGLAGGYLSSDRRGKTEIEDGDADADALLKGLKAYTYRYKNEANGKGKQIGVMAQDLEKVAPQAVIDTPRGKVVDGAKLSGALAAAVARMSRRLEKVEGKR